MLSCGKKRADLLCRALLIAAGILGLSSRADAVLAVQYFYGTLDVTNSNYQLSNATMLLIESSYTFTNYVAAPVTLTPDAGGYSYQAGPILVTPSTNFEFAMMANYMLPGDTQPDGIAITMPAAFAADGALAGGSVNGVPFDQVYNVTTSEQSFEGELPSLCGLCTVPSDLLAFLQDSHNQGTLAPTFDFNQVSLDLYSFTGGNSIGSGTVTESNTAAPEPSFLPLLAGLGLGIAAYWKRQRPHGRASSK